MSSAAPRWRLGGQIELRQGLDILGASEACNFVCALVRTPTTRGDGDPTSTLIRGEISAEAALGDHGFQVAARADANAGEDFLQLLAGWTDFLVVLIVIAHLGTSRCIASG